MIKNIFTMMIAVCFSLVSVGMVYGADKSPVLAKVGRIKITEQQLNDRLSQYPEQSQAFFQKEENKARLLDQLIDEEVIYQYAKKKKVF